MAKLGREVVNALLMGPSAEGRLVHESPVRGDVWAALAAAPGRPVDVLIEAYRNVETGLVASRLARRLYGYRPDPGRVSEDHSGFGISYVEGFVAARLGLEDLTMHALPFSAWARDLRNPSADYRIAVDVAALVREQLSALADPGDAVREAEPKIARVTATFRMLAGLYWALDQENETFASVAEFLAAANPT